MATNAFINFMGVSEDVRRYEETTKALEHSEQLLSLHEYSKLVGFNYIDELWHSLDGKRYIITNDMLLEWLGLDHKQRKMSRSMFVNILKSDEILYEKKLRY